MAETKGITYIRMMLDILNKKEAQLTSLLELTTAQEKLLKDEIASGKIEIRDI